MPMLLVCRYVPASAHYAFIEVSNTIVVGYIPVLSFHGVGADIGLIA